MRGSFMRLYLVLALVVLTACKQNPYPDSGSLEPREPRTPRQVEPTLSLAIDDVIEYYEGRELRYGIRAAVKEPGLPELSIDNLPSGATFDKEKMILAWKPSFFDGNNPKDPSIKSRIYPITIWLRSSLDQTQAIKKQVSLVVHDVPREIKVNGNASITVSENQKMVYRFSIANEDYPQGPFKVVTSDFPANTHIIKENENNYRLEFEPDYYHVNIRTDGTSKSYKGKIIVANPANHMQEKPVDLRVNDSRLSSKIVAPERLVQGLDVSFQVAAYDLNKEVTPQIELLSNRPGFGQFRTELVQNAENHSAVLNIFWNDIPPVNNGQKFTLRYRSCVLSSAWSYNKCEQGSTEIEIVVRDRKPPTINRSNFAVGEMLYLGFNERQTRSVLVRDGEDANLKPKVEIFPETLRKYVSWNNGTLTMQFKEAGVFQFNLLATSDYNVSSSESFLVEVFPETRSKTLFFADSSRDAEARFYRDNLKNVDVMNPFIQDINVRNISNRETLVLGTSILLDKEANDAILKAMGKIKNLVIASPMLENMPIAFLDELREQYNMDFVGRFNDLPRTPDLKKTYFAFTNQFQKPVGKVGLKLTTTVESSNPLIFNGGLDDADKLCKGVLGLTDTGFNPYVIGVVCKRNNGGKLILLGTEWADFAVESSDANIPSLWFDKMLTGRFH
jgi:hypothetical protein